MFQRPKGTKDLFGINAKIFTLIKNTYFEVCKNFNFNYIETPIFEDVNLFKRTSGEFSDIVTKEMYVFEDKSNRQMALRPEGTAPTIRAIVENKLYANSKLEQKYFYFGPSFRYEQPQKGRQRQFYQAGVEFLADLNPYNDLEVLLLAKALLQKLKINDYVLKINCLGTVKERIEYSQALVKYLEKFQDQLEPVSLTRLSKNPLRILDDKIESQKQFIKDAPKIVDFLNQQSMQNFKALLKLLDELNIKYEYDLNLVRGLDYYDEMVFEFVSLSPALGSQSTILAGGRYNNLISQLGGPEQSAIGFGCGVERLLEMMLYQKELYLDKLDLLLDFYVASFNDEELIANTKVVNLLRINGFNVDGSKSAEKLKNAFKNALSAKYIVFREIDQSPLEITIKENGQNFKKVVSLVEIVASAKELIK